MLLLEAINNYYRASVLFAFEVIFLNSDTVLLDSIQKISPTFDKLKEIEDWSMTKFETVRIYFCYQGNVT